MRLLVLVRSKDGGYAISYLIPKDKNPVLFGSRVIEFGAPFNYLLLHNDGIIILFIYFSSFFM